MSAPECRGCDGMGRVSVPGPLARAAQGWREWMHASPVREWCVCGECAGTGQQTTSSAVGQAPLVSNRPDS